MKIFISFLQSQIQHPIAAYSFWEYYIKNGIEEFGANWVECKDIDWAKGLVQQSEEEFSAWKTSSWEKAISYLKENPVDLFLSYLYPEQVDSSAIAEIQKMGTPCVNFFCDHVRMFKKVPKEFAIFDLNWVPEYKAIKFYRDAQLAYIYLPMPMWVEQKYRTIADEETDQIVFIGSKDIQRHLFFEQLSQQVGTSKIDIYGSGWIDETQGTVGPIFSTMDKLKNQINFLSKHGICSFYHKLKHKSYHPAISETLSTLLRGKPSFDDYVRITRESAITLGINRYPSFNFPMHQPDTYSRLRDIEAPMLGACYLTEYTEGLEDLYDLDQEILTYQQIDDFLDKSKMLAQDKQRRTNLRTAGQQKALNQLNISSSLQQIINVLNGQDRK
ncbi:glycosyltransferase family 1 protein [Pedobacter sp. ISL-68]|uniref:glycosyltransferase family protein n=1 Tax=unclassified Pedobacter TaxID=2628915 RepID=UPI001BEB6F34|nr:MULTISPECIES: glycosyltransferase [unclassified Pedobacter]MBT2562799.1 glycosyltransferase family 1 protein [Pedobacter sp. ISL-64]MBT2593312.1 glycosyltransferase family 1 protein [Pedobacter sp. ISL-68]